MASDKMRRDVTFVSVTNVHRHNACCSANTGFNWTTMDAKHAHVITVHKHNV